jgi:hypothetical protein
MFGDPLDRMNRSIGPPAANLFHRWIETLMEGGPWAELVERPIVKGGEIMGTRSTGISASGVHEEEIKFL